MNTGKSRLEARTTIHICLVSIALCWMLSCGGNDPADGVLESYRITIGETPKTFDDQILYLLLALEIYRLHVGTYPPESINLEGLISQPEIGNATERWRGPYIESAAVFVDPWGRRLRYTVNEQGKYDLRSLGLDGTVSADDLQAKTMHPDVFREMEKLPAIGPIPIPPNKSPLPLGEG